MLNKYFKDGYTFTRICVNCDLSICAIQQALIELNFKIENRYTLICSVQNLGVLTKLGEIVDLDTEFEEGLGDAWALADLAARRLVYSMGA